MDSTDRVARRSSEPRCRPPRLLLATAALSLALTGPGGAACRAAGIMGPAMALFPDFAGVTGTLDAVLLNPAAATGLEGTTLTVRIAPGAPASETTGSSLAYAVAMLDRGPALSGGFTGVLETPPAGERRWKLGYTVAAELGWAALGARATWMRLQPASGPAQSGWGADVGFSARLGQWGRAGLSAFNLPVGESLPGSPPQGARAGITVSPAPGSGVLVAVGLSEQDVPFLPERAVDAAILIPLGKRVNLAAGYELDARTLSRGRWSAAIGVELSDFRVEAGYQSGGNYQVGISGKL